MKASRPDRLEEQEQNQKRQKSTLDFNPNNQIPKPAAFTLFS